MQSLGPDFQYLAEQTQGDQALQRELLSLFKAQSRQILRDLQNAPRGAQDFAGASLHRLKGSALAVGARRVAAMASTYEALLFGADQSEAPAALGALKTAIEDAAAAIDQRLGPP